MLLVFGEAVESTLSNRIPCIPQVHVDPLTEHDMLHIAGNKFPSLQVEAPDAHATKCSPTPGKVNVLSRMIAFNR